MLLSRDFAFSFFFFFSFYHMKTISKLAYHIQ